jgi:50S ribosomal protein L16 3-hydroxylase
VPASSLAWIVDAMFARMVADAIEAVFGISAQELFSKRELFVQHGPLERFPSFMFNGPMASTDALCREYAGAVEVSQGSELEGSQFPVSGAHPLALLRAGLTVYFSDLRRLLPASQPFLRGLESALGLGECASVMAFVNAPGSGLPLHHDRYDQLFFQIRGDKTFRYAPNGFVEQPDLQFSPANAAQVDFGQRYASGFPRTTREVLDRPFQTLLLEPGSAFFMPAGTWHTTAGQTEETLSLVVAVRAPSRLDLLLNLLRYYAGQDPAWRERTYGAWSTDESLAAREQNRWAPLLQDLAERLPALPISALRQAWSVHAFVNGTQAEYPAERFERFIRLPNSSLQFGDDPSGKLRCTVLSGPNHRPQNRTMLGIDPEAREVVEWILQSRAAFTVSQLCETFPDFARDDLENLLSWLGRAALVRPIPIPPWSHEHP